MVSSNYILSNCWTSFATPFPLTHTHTMVQTCIVQLSSRALCAPAVRAKTELAGNEFQLFLHTGILSALVRLTDSEKQGFNQTVILSQSRDTNLTSYQSAYRNVLCNDDKVRHPVSPGLQAG